MTGRGPLWLLPPKFLFYTRDLRVGVDAAPTPADAVWREFTPDDVEAVAALVPDERPERIQRRLDNGAHTAPAFRKRGIFADSIARVLMLAQREGYVRSISHAAWWNYPTRGSVLRRTGRRPVGHVGYWNLEVARRYLATGGVRLGAERTLWIDRTC